MASKEYSAANSIKERVKERLMQDMVTAVKSRSEWRVLIVDHHAMRVISACCRMSDIMERGVTLVENIQLNRQPLPGFDAIYFITPTDESISLLCRDFENPTSPKYMSAHVFLTSSMSDAQFDTINNSQVKRYLKTLKEINVDFLPIEAQAMSLDVPTSLHTLYSPLSQDSAALFQKRIAAQISTMCSVLGECPIVRFSKNSEQNEAIARSVQEQLDDLLKYGDIPAPGKQRSQLIIVDRGLDPISPLVHEMTYQAIAYDVLNIENDKYTFVVTSSAGLQQKKEALLSETDQLWPSVRHLHIAEAIKNVTSGFKRFVSTSKSAKLGSTGGGGKVSMDELAAALKNMPQHQEKMHHYQLHMDMVERCMGVFDSENLEQIAKVEQDMVMGEDVDGNKIKNHIPSLVPILQNDNVSVTNKLRVILLYIITKNGINDSDREKLIDHASIPQEDRAVINNITNLGVTLSSNDKKKLMKRHERKEDNVYALSRWVPYLKDIMEDAIDNKVNKDNFSFVCEDVSVDSIGATDAGAMSLRSNKPGWATKNKDKKSDAPGSAGKSWKSQAAAGSRVIIFVVGGMCYSEMRAAYEVSAKTGREVLIGSTHIITSESFLDQLAGLDKPLPKTQQAGTVATTAERKNDSDV